MALGPLPETSCCRKIARQRGQARLNNGDLERRPAAALRFLARHPGGCTEAALLKQGFTAVSSARSSMQGLPSYEEQAARRWSG
jgi:hypothetical protein